MGIFALILLILALSTLGFFIFKVIKVVKNHVIGEEKYKIQGNERLLLLGLVCGVALLLTTAAVLSAIHFKNAGKWWEFLLLVLGTLIAGTAVPFSVGAFILFYYKLDLDEKQRNICKFAWPISIIVFFLGLLLLTEGIARNIEYPLVSGIATGTGWTRGGELGSGMHIKFYGIIIVTGALICYAITDHEMYKKFKKHGLIDTLFILVFLLGIVGARLWYCLILEPDIYLTGKASIFAIMDGGLAIQGGAIFGFIVAIIYMLLFRRYIDLRFILDVAAPTVLIAQAMGRWGNFFNQEVYGLVTTKEALWYLPTIVKNNMFINHEYRVPLFFIESVINLVGYFTIRYGIGKLCKAYKGLGFQGASYLIWYGLTRVLLEPLRNGYTASTKTEGFGYLQSYITAFVMIGLGVAGCVAFYIVHKTRMKKGLEDKFGDKII